MSNNSHKVGKVCAHQRKKTRTLVSRGILDQQSHSVPADDSEAHHGVKGAVPKESTHYFKIQKLAKVPHGDRILGTFGRGRLLWFEWETFPMDSSI